MSSRGHPSGSASAVRLDPGQPNEAQAAHQLGLLHRPGRSGSGRSDLTLQFMETTHDLLTMGALACLLRSQHVPDPTCPSRVGTCLQLHI
jgi:hypothetical protein